MKELYLIPRLTYEGLLRSKQHNVATHGNESSRKSLADSSENSISSKDEGKVRIHLDSIEPPKTEKKTTKAVFKTLIPPLIKKRRENMIPLRLNETGNNNDNKSPSLADIAPAYFTESRLPYVNSVLRYMQKSNNIQWDEEGNLYSPFKGFNILDIVKGFTGKDKVNDEYLQDFKHLMKIVNMPASMIKNKSLVRQLHDAPKIKRGAGKSYPRKVSHQDMAWVPY